MTKRIYALVSLQVEVFNPIQLKNAAAARAMEEGLSLRDWEESHRGPCDDLRMLLDPGIIPGAGFSINDSACE